MDVKIVLGITQHAYLKVLDSDLVFKCNMCDGRKDLKDNGWTAGRQNLFYPFHRSSVVLSCLQLKVYYADATKVMYVGIHQQIAISMSM